MEWFSAAATDEVVMLRSQIVLQGISLFAMGMTIGIIYATWTTRRELNRLRTVLDGSDAVLKRCLRIVAINYIHALVGFTANAPLTLNEALQKLNFTFDRILHRIKHQNEPTLDANDVLFTAAKAMESGNSKGVNDEWQDAVDNLRTYGFRPIKKD